MAESKALVWDADTKRLFETGVSKAVLYPVNNTGAYGKGVAWNGLRSVNQNPTGADETKLYANNAKYLGLRAAEEFEGSISAYTYPDEFMACNGEAQLGGVAGLTVGQQARKPFGLSYQTRIGNDVDGDDHGYKIHLVYGCTVNPSSAEYQTINDSPEAIELSWDFSTTPVKIAAEGFRPTSHLVIDSTKFTNDTKLKALEDMLYGSATADPKLPLPDEVLSMLKA